LFVKNIHGCKRHKQNNNDFATYQKDIREFTKRSITNLTKDLGISRNSLLNYLTILERGGLINLLQSSAKGINTLAKPEKIYLNNTNQIYVFDTNRADIENLRETFFSINYRLLKR
jgi:hypothetical protein